MGFRAGSDKGMSGRYSTGRTESVGVELGISMEGTSFQWKRNQWMCVWNFLHQENGVRVIEAPSLQCRG